MGLGISVPNGQDMERYFKNAIDYTKSHHKDILGEASETATATAIAAPINTAASVATTGRLERAHMLKNPAWTAKRFLRKAGPLGVAVSTGVDTYQGRDSAYRIFGKNANMGQRAVAIGSSIANGATLGAFNFNDPKAVKKMYKYYGGK